MMNLKACGYLQKQPLLHVDMLAVLHRGTGEVIAESDRGVLLYEKIHAPICSVPLIYKLHSALLKILFNRI